MVDLDAPEKKTEKKEKNKALEESLSELDAEAETDINADHHKNREKKIQKAVEMLDLKSSEPESESKAQTETQAETEAEKMENVELQDAVQTEKEPEPETIPLKKHKPIMLNLQSDNAATETSREHEKMKMPDAKIDNKSESEEDVKKEASFVDIASAVAEQSPPEDIVVPKDDLGAFNTGPQKSAVAVGADTDADPDTDGGPVDVQSEMDENSNNEEIKSKISKTDDEEEEGFMSMFPSMDSSHLVLMSVGAGVVFVLIGLVIFCNRGENSSSSSSSDSNRNNNGSYEKERLLASDLEMGRQQDHHSPAKSEGWDEWEGDANLDEDEEEAKPTRRTSSPSPAFNSDNGSGSSNNSSKRGTSPAFQKRNNSNGSLGSGGGSNGVLKLTPNKGSNQTGNKLETKKQTRHSLSHPKFSKKSDDLFAALGVEASPKGYVSNRQSSSPSPSSSLPAKPGGVRVEDKNTHEEVGKSWEDADDFLDELSD